MVDKIEITTPRNLTRMAQLVGSPSNSPPDAAYYTSCVPSSSAVSYIPFGALSADIGGAKPFSYALLARVRSFGSWTWLPTGYVSGQEVVTFSDGTNQGQIWLWSGPQGFSWSFGYLNGAFQYTGMAEYDKWAHLAFTWDGTNAIAYLNGSAASLKLSQSVLSKPTFTLGLDATDPPAKPSQGVTSGPFIGDIQSFYVWDVALSPADVQQQMWNTPSSPIQESNLLLGYDFTTNPPSKVGSGPNASPTNTTARGNASALASWGVDVATPGEGTVINPGGSAAFSVLGWIFVGNDAWAPAKLDGYVFCNGASDAADHMGLKLSDGSLVAEFGTNTITSSSKLSGYLWYYVGLTYDGTNATLYVDNVQVASGPLSGSSPSPAAPVLFGALNSTGAVTGGFQGYIQFLSVWDTCLTAAEVQQQADEDPTFQAGCVANFMCSDEPSVDSVAVKTAGLWGENSLSLGSNFFLGTTSLANTSGGQRQRAHASAQDSRDRVNLDLSAFRGSGPLRAATATPLSDAHKQLMVNELKTAASSMADTALAERWTLEFSAEVDRVFDLARTNPEQIEGPHVTYEVVDGEYALFYHPDPGQKIDLGVRVDISQECAIWWAAFILTVFLGVFTIFGISTPIDKMTALAKKIVTDPVVIETCTTVVGFTFTAGTLLSFCKVLYDFGYLSQAFWLVASSIGWWGAGKLLVYFVGCLLPVPSPQKALFIANCVVLVAKLVVKLGGYSAACGSGESAPIAAK